MAPIALQTSLDTSIHAPVKSPVSPHTAKQTSSPSAQLRVAGAVPTAVSASGLYITLSDGRVILDAVSGGAAVSAIGMGNKEVVEVMKEQATKMAYCYHQLVGNDSGEKLAEQLTRKSGMDSAAFLSSGSEAMEAAIKLCRQYWVEKGESQRKYIIARFPSYHGNTLGALAIGNVPSRRDIYSPLISECAQHVPSPTYKRSHLDNESEEAYSLRLAAELDAKILELGPENVMAFIAEPVVGAALGVMPPPKGYFPAINAIVQKHGLLFVMDEVMSGSGRCGELFAHQAVAEGIKPDILAMAKGLGGGYVCISAVLVNARVGDVVRKAGQWKNSHTYQNHPINSAVAGKVLEIMERDGLFANVRERGTQLRRLLREGFKGVLGVFDVRGAGLFIGVEFDVCPTLKPRMAMRVKDRCMQNGLLVLGLTGIIDGHDGDSVTLAPAYTVSEEQIKDISRIFVRSVKECLAEL